jgi:UDP-3-O-[3-hydroxymyristoyl] glucosamine N-acyltransferase
MKFTSPISLRQIVALIPAASLKGDENFMLKGINEIHLVEEGDLTFVDHEKYYVRALQSNASVILINKEAAVPGGKHLIVTDDPFRDYNFLTRHFMPFRKAETLISRSAMIGEGTVVQPGAFIGNDVQIGRNCLIHAQAVIMDHCILGNDCIIHPQAVIGADAFYFKRYSQGYERMHSCGRAILGNRVEVGSCSTIDRGVSGDTLIGDGCKFDNHVHVGHDTVIGKNCLFAAHVGIAGVVRIEDDVILWGQVGVNKDLVIGKGAIVYAQSGVASSIPGGQVYFGSPVLPAKEKMKELGYLKRLKELFQKTEVRRDETN